MLRSVLVTCCVTLTVLVGSIEAVYLRRGSLLGLKPAQSTEILEANVVSNITQSPLYQSLISNSTKPSLAITVSGGGSRSTICSIGGFRALGNLADKVDMVSSVSGGTWFSSVYMFQKKYSDVELLGVQTQPSELTKDFLSSHNPGKLGETLTTKSDQVAAKFLKEGLDLSLLWQYSVAEIFLKPFRLDNHSQYLAASQSQVDSILKLNPALNEDQFLVQNDKRPPLFVMGGTLGAPLLYTTDESNIAYFKMTPGYVGSPYGNPGSSSTSTYAELTYTSPYTACDLFYMYQAYVANLSKKQKLKYKVIKKDILSKLSPKMKAAMGKVFGAVENKVSCDKSTATMISDITVNVGGGILEAFAFGGEKINGQNNAYGPNQVSAPQEPFALSLAVGISSAAFATEFTNVEPLQSLNPRATYWPVGPGNQASTVHQLADGGNLENLGLVSAIKEGMNKTLTFVNTDNAIVNVSQVDLCDPLNWINATMEEIYSWGSGEISNKFGYYNPSSTSIYGGVYSYNQIFKSEDYQEFLCDAQKLMTAGKPVVLKKKYELVDNSFWSISGGRSVEVMWVVNQKCSNFEEQLPVETQQEIANGGLIDFPYYPTSFANGIQVTTMTLEQINLLAAQTEYAINENIEMITEFLSTTQ